MECSSLSLDSLGNSGKTNKKKTNATHHTREDSLARSKADDVVAVDGRLLTSFEVRNPLLV